MGAKIPSWNDIKLFFRGVDIAMMRADEIVPAPVILDSFEQVKTQAWTIRSRVASTEPSAPRMPPPPYARWTPEQVEAFGSWMDNSTPHSSPEAVEAAAKFIALSKLLTGFDTLELDPELALKHLARLHARDDISAVVDDLIDKHDAMNEEDFKKQILDGSDSDYRRVAEVIILLWYTGAFFEGRFPSDSGTPDDNQYTQGLVWRAVRAHPMGYSTEGGQYWQYEPRPDGLYTGLGNTMDGRAPGQDGDG